MPGLHSECVGTQQLEKCVGRILRTWLARRESMSEMPAVDIRRVPQPHLYPEGSISDLKAWNLTIAHSLRRIGRNPSFIVFARLTRRAKSAECSWEQIQAELERATGNLIAVTDLKQMYVLGVGFLHLDIANAGITTAYKELVAA